MDLYSPFAGTLSRSPSGSLVSLSEGSDGAACLSSGTPVGHHGRSVYTARHHREPVLQNHAHPNLFVRGIPLHWTEEQLVELFSQFGDLSSLRLVKHSVRKTSLGYGFVRYHDASNASAAISGLHGKMVDGQILQVKLADSDAGPPSTSSVSGLSPCDTLYVKHVPLSFSKQDLEQLFGQCGKVVDVKEFPCLDQFRGSSALIKMDSVASATLAIKRVHGLKPHGWLHNVIVRFAESEKEKKERLARKESQKKMAADLTSDLSGELGSLSTFIAPKDVAAPSNVQNITSMANVSDRTNGAVGMGDVSSVTLAANFANMSDTFSSLGGLPGVGHLASTSRPHGHQQNQQSVMVLVTNIPPLADRLWMYEHFSRFGGIQSMSLDQRMGVARINFSELAAGMRAVLEMNQQHGLTVALA